MPFYTSRARRGNHAQQTAALPAQPVPQQPVARHTRKKTILGRPNLPKHAQTHPNTRKKRIWRDLTRPGANWRAQTHSQTLRFTYTGTPDLRAPHVACKRPISPDAAAFSPPFLDSPARGADTGTSTVSQRTPICTFCAFSVLRVTAMLKIVVRGRKERSPTAQRRRALPLHVSIPAQCDDERAWARRRG